MRALSVSLLFFSSRRRHTRSLCDWSSDVCSSDLIFAGFVLVLGACAHAPIEQSGTHLRAGEPAPSGTVPAPVQISTILPTPKPTSRSEERRVGKECRSRWSPYH